MFWINLSNKSNEFLNNLSTQNSLDNKNKIFWALISAIITGIIGMLGLITALIIFIKKYKKIEKNNIDQLKKQKRKIIEISFYLILDFIFLIIIITYLLFFW
ncbi:hypothetical protein [[Mycoplasma] collis]|uniref:hypothetical protein n=1 Tax=[Mycoplasma] collis TaxID=2127 RepID=UPI00051C3BC2|nr:hypothetical protein [[Mycoplasma] collis]